MASNLQKFIILFMAVLSVSACKLEIKPPTLPFTASTTVNTSNSDSEKVEKDNILDKLLKQSNLEKLENEDVLKNFYSNNLSHNCVDCKATLSLEESSNSQDIIDQKGYTENLNSNQELNKDSALISVPEKPEKVKISGQHIYEIVGQSVIIVEAYPAEKAKQVAEIKFKYEPTSILISNDKLVVTGDYIINKEKYSYVKIFSISQKNDPKVINEIDLRTDTMEPRLIDGFLYLTSSLKTFVDYRTNKIFPSFKNNGKEENCLVSEGCSFPNVFYLNVPYRTYNLFGVYALDLRKDVSQLKRSFYILPHNHKIYIGLKSAYLVYPRYVDSYLLETETMAELLMDDLSDSGKKKLNAIAKADNLVLDENERLEKSRLVFEQHFYSLEPEAQNSTRLQLGEKFREKKSLILNESNKSVIHKINFANGESSHFATGDISGSLNSGQHLTELESGLLIFADTNRKSVGITENELCLYDEKLNLEGKLVMKKNENETITFGTVGNKVFVFDPLKNNKISVVDISNKKEPSLKGDLALPDKADQLQIFDSNTLIAMGNGLKNKEGAISPGVYIALYNIEDPSKPILIDSQILGGAGSVSKASKNMSTFFFSSEKKNLIIPVSIRNAGPGIFGNQNFDGAVAFAIESKKINMRGLLDNTKVNDKITGFRYINDVLYTFLEDGLRLNSLKGLNKLKDIAITPTTKKPDHEYSVIKY